MSVCIVRVVSAIPVGRRLRGCPVFSVSEPELLGQILCTNSRTGLTTVDSLGMSVYNTAKSSFQYCLQKNNRRLILLLV